MDKSYFSLLVENRSGVLSRISGLFARRGFNIDGLTVCATEDERYSRMTVSLVGDERVIKQIRAQLEKQVEVIKIIELSENESVLRELLLIKIRAESGKISEIVDITTIYKAKTIDISDDSITLELTGRAQKIDSFIKILAPYGIYELARSGVSALQRGKNVLRED